MQKQRFSYLVPWEDGSEWREVRKQLLSDDFDDKVKAYETMSVWKLRGEAVPAYTECTALMLQVLMDDHNARLNANVNDNNLKLSYTTAIIRFVNHLQYARELRSDSLYKAAKVQNIPDWIITMRHDAAHGRDLPSIDTFQLAAKVCLEWLLKNYWLHEEISLQYLQPSLQQYGGDLLTYKINFNLLPIFNSALRIWKGCSDCMNTSLTKVKDLSKDQLNCLQEIVNTCENKQLINEDMVKNVKVFNKLISHYKSDALHMSEKSVHIMKLKVHIMKFITHLCCDETAMYTLIQALLQSDFMLDTMQQEWRRIIRMLQSLKCFNMFLNLLFELAENDEMAMGLLDSLLRSIKALRAEWPKYQSIKRTACSEEELAMAKKKEKEKYWRKCKNIKFPLRIQLPPKIRLGTVYKLLMNPNEKSRKLIFKCLMMVEPSLSESLINKIMELVSVYCGDKVGDTDSESDKIYTLEDIKEKYKQKLGIVDDKEPSLCRTWTKSHVGPEEWSSCPLGLLPNQKSTNLTLLRTLKWRRTWSRKRPHGFLSGDGDDLRKYLKINRR